LDAWNEQVHEGKNAFAIEKITGFRAQWIIDGQGEKTLDPEYWETEKLATDETHVFIPQLDVKACAGNGHAADEHVQVIGELAFKRSWMLKRNLTPKHLRVLECKGASMMPYLADGDTMLVDITTLEPRHGEVFVLCEGDMTLVKRLVRERDGWLLTSDNPDKTTYRDAPLLDDAHRIIGRVVWRAG
jgi:phage repressor protein C with HTH and peptisase S24 domain